MTGLLHELKRRNVFRVAVAYTVVGWVVLQVAEFLSPLLQLPEWTVSLALYVGIIGFPFALLFAWAFELTPEGLRLTEHVEPEQSITSKTGKTLNRTIISLMGVAIVLLLVDRFVNVELEQETDDKVTAAEQPAEAIPAAATAARPDGKSIAVLPFVNMSKDPDQEYFSDGISEELLNGLAKINDLRVAARTSSFAFKGQNTDITEIGKQLKVGTVLEGSVRKAGTRVRITAQLIDVEDGYHLWSETYDRELDDIFAIQDEISTAIVDALKVHLTDGESSSPVQKPVNIEAYNFYLLARHNLRLRNAGSLRLAVKQYQQALDKAPDFAPAYAGQALATHLLSVDNYGETPSPIARRQAQALVDKAFALDPTLSEAHAIQGLIYSDQMQLDEAEISLRKAIAGNPSEGIVYSWLAGVISAKGDYQNAVQIQEQAFSIDPLHPAIRTNVANRMAAEGGIAAAREMVTPGTSQAYFVESNIQRDAGHYAEMYNNLLKGIETSEKGGLARSRVLLGMSSFFELAEPEDDLAMLPLGLAQALASVADPAQARTLLAQVPTGQRDEWYYWAMAWSQLKLGEPAAALQTLDEIYSPDEPVYSFASNAIPSIEFAALYACGLRGVGDNVAANTLAGRIVRFVEMSREKGTPPRDNRRYLSWGYAIQDNADQSLVTMRHALADYDLVWLDLQAPCVDSLADTEEYRELEAAVYQHLNRERALLGWAPVSAPVPRA